jgi:hypothetical protein
VQKYCQTRYLIYRNDIIQFSLVNPTHMLSDQFTVFSHTDKTIHAIGRISAVNATGLNIGCCLPLEGQSQ